MNDDQKKAISEFDIFWLLEFVFSGFVYGHLCSFAGGPKEGEKSLGFIKSETTKNLYFISRVLTQVHTKRKSEYLRSLMENRLGSKDKRLFLRHLEARQSIISSLFRLSLIEEFSQVLSLKKVSVVQGWEVVSLEEIPEPLIIGKGRLFWNFFSLFRNVISCGYFNRHDEGMPLNHVGSGEKVIGYLPASAQRISSLFSLIEKEASYALEETGLELDVEPGSCSVFEEINLLLERYPNIKFPYLSFLLEIMNLTETVYWTIINDQFKYLRVDELGVRAGYKVVLVKKVSSS